MERPRRLLLAAVAVLLLGGFLTVIGPYRIIGELSGAHPLGITFALAASLASLLCWGEAQRRLHSAAGARIAPGRFFPAYSAAVFAKLVIPGGRAGGPAIVAYVVGKESDLAYEQDLAATSIGQLVGLFAAVVPTLAGFALLAAGERQSVVGAGDVAIVVLTMTLGVGTLLWAMRVRSAAIRWWIHAGATTIRVTIGRMSYRARRAVDPARVDRALDRTANTLSAIGDDPRALPLAFMLSVAGWVCAAITLHATLIALGHTVPSALSLFAVPLVSLATVVPVPSGLGGVEFALAGVLVGLTPLTLPEVGAVVVLYRVCSDLFLAVVGAAGALARSHTT